MVLMMRRSLLWATAMLVAITCTVSLVAGQPTMSAVETTPPVTAPTEFPTQPPATSEPTPVPPPPPPGFHTTTICRVSAPQARARRATSASDVCGPQYGRCMGFFIHTTATGEPADRLVNNQSGLFLQ